MPSRRRERGPVRAVQYAPGCFFLPFAVAVAFAVTAMPVVAIVQRDASALGMGVWLIGVTSAIGVVPYWITRRVEQRFLGRCERVAGIVTGSGEVVTDMGGHYAVRYRVVGADTEFVQEIDKRDLGRCGEGMAIAVLRDRTNPNRTCIEGLGRFRLPGPRLSP